MESVNLTPEEEKELENLLKEDKAEKKLVEEARRVEIEQLNKEIQKLKDQALELKKQILALPDEDDAENEINNKQENFDYFKEKLPSKIDLYFPGPNSDGSLDIKNGLNTYKEGASIFELQNMGNETFEVYVKKEATHMLISYPDNIREPLFESMVPLGESVGDIFSAKAEVIKPAIVKKDGEKLVLVEKGIIDIDGIGVAREKKLIESGEKSYWKNVLTGKIDPAESGWNSKKEDFAKIKTLEDLYIFIDNYPDLKGKLNKINQLKTEIKRVSDWWNQAGAISKAVDFNNFESTFISFGIQDLVKKLREIFEKRDKDTTEKTKEKISELTRLYNNANYSREGRKEFRQKIKIDFEFGNKNASDEARGKGENKDFRESSPGDFIGIKKEEGKYEVFPSLGTALGETSINEGGIGTLFDLPGNTNNTSEFTVLTPAIILKSPNGEVKLIKKGLINIGENNYKYE